MKVAIVHDDLMRKGGAEQVALSMMNAFPDADLYTMCYDARNSYPEYGNYKIKTSWLQYFAKDANMMKYLFFPFGIWAMNSLELNDYDVVILSTTFAAKHVKISPSTLLFSYCHIPFRLAWDPYSYAQYKNSAGLKRWLFDRIITKLKKADYLASKRTDYFITNATEVAERIKNVYDVSDVKIIKPDVKTKNFYISNIEKGFYLVVSRLEFYKKVDLVIDAFNKLGSKLIIVGKGIKSDELKAMANNNIEFRTGLSSEELADLYAHCKALIFPQHEDYGITPLEANASGRPVIAYGVGGVLDTMIPFTNDASKATAVFFNQQTVDSLILAVNKFESLKFDPAFIRAHAEKFDEQVFVEELKNFVEEKYKESLTSK